MLTFSFVFRETGLFLQVESLWYYAENFFYAIVMSLKMVLLKVGCKFESVHLCKASWVV